ncbi:MAG TPA: phytanoyl-CoA dioxygenase family protein, partial [Limnochordia bacterium]
MRHQVEVSVDRGAADHPPGLYRFDRPASGVQGFDDVNDEAIERFRSEGYLVIERAFTPAEVEDALVAISDLIGGKHPDFRGIQLEAAARERWPELSDLERQDAVRKLMAFVRYDSRLDALAHHPRLRDLLTRIMGEPPELFQDMALLKPPRIGREKPWHQD